MAPPSTRSDSLRALALLIVQIGMISLAAPGMGRRAEAVRAPFNALFAPLLHTFRVSQTWFLYRDGPEDVRRLEVLVDGALVYRSRDPDHATLAGVLENRRLRPVVESTCERSEGAPAAQLARFVARRVVETQPDAQEIELRCTIAPFPGDDAVVDQALVLRAPGWEPP